jgi:rSAM/selenodomain-associated transferase 2
MLAFAPPMKVTISAVVPALDEELEIVATLAALAPVADEIVVADGGSSDRTRDRAREAGASVVEGARGRAAQMNAGARASSGSLLLFVHADTRLAPSARPSLLRAAGSGAVGGAFRIRFDAEGALYRLGGAVASWRSRWTGLAFGDQAQFARREVFERLGGFREWPILEDLDFARRLRRAGRVAILAPPVVTSARRFQRSGPVRTVLRNWWILVRYSCGVSPEKLARRYRDAR